MQEAKNDYLLYLGRMMATAASCAGKEFNKDDVVADLQKMGNIYIKISNDIKMNKEEEEYNSFLRRLYELEKILFE